MSGGATDAGVAPAPRVPAPLTVGALLGRTFSIWGRNLVAVTLACALAYAPVAAVLALPAFGISIEAVHARGFASLPARLWMTLTVHLLASGVVACAVVEQLPGGRVRAGALLAAIPLRAPALLPVAVVQALVVEIALGAAVVPGVWARLVLFVAAPAVAVERCGVGDAFRRSRALTRGRLGTIFAAVFVLSLFMRMVDTGTTAVIAALEAQGTWLGWTIGQAVAAFAIGPIAVASAVAYHALRTASEGDGGGDLARVFE